MFVSHQVCQVVKTEWVDRLKRLVHISERKSAKSVLHTLSTTSRMDISHNPQFYLDCVHILWRVTFRKSQESIWFVGTWFNSKPVSLQSKTILELRSILNSSHSRIWFYITVLSSFFHFYGTSITSLVLREGRWLRAETLQFYSREGKKRKIVLLQVWKMRINFCSLSFKIWVEMWFLCESFYRYSSITKNNSRLTNRNGCKSIITDLRQNNNWNVKNMFRIYCNKKKKVTSG